MKLFLASEAKNQKTIPVLEEFVGGFKDKNIAYIPTASNGHGWENWKTGGSWNIVQNFGSNIEVVLLEDYVFEDITPVLQKKDIIWFAGGSCSYLMYWLIATKINQSLPKLLENGSVYVGSSAGSMVTSKTLDVACWYIGETEPIAQFLPGLGLVDFDIYPHYHDELYDQITKLYKGNKLYLLKDGEEIMVNGTQVTIIGEERIIK